MPQTSTEAQAEENSRECRRRTLLTNPVCSVLFLVASFRYASRPHVVSSLVALWRHLCVSTDVSRELITESPFQITLMLNQLDWK